MRHVTDDPYFKEFIKPVLAQNGDKLPVSTLCSRRLRTHRHHQV